MRVQSECAGFTVDAGISDLDIGWRAIVAYVERYPNLLMAMKKAVRTLMQKN